MGKEEVELMEILEYSLWQNFHKTINIAVKNCNNSNYDVSDHFIDANKMRAVTVFL